jgi:hypothetical protein
MGTHIWNHQWTVLASGPFIAGLQDALEAAGMVQVPATGQFDRATYAPSGGGTNGALMTYLLYRFDDPAQAQFPVFLRIAFHHGSAVTAFVARITVGSGATAAGDITGAYVPEYNQGAINSPNSTEGPSFASGDGSSLAVMVGPASVSTASMFTLLLERTRTTDGTPTAGGLVFGCWMTQSGTPSVYFIAPGFVRAGALLGLTPNARADGTQLHAAGSGAAFSPQRPTVWPLVFAVGGVAFLSRRVALAPPGDLIHHGSVLRVEMQGDPLVFRGWGAALSTQGTSARAWGALSLSVHNTNLLWTAPLIRWDSFE